MRVVHIQTTGTSTKTITEIAILDIASRRGNALPFDMMMVTFLRKPNLCLKTQHLRPVFTQRTIHIVAALQNFPHTISKGGNDLWVVIQIARFDEFDIGIGRSNLVSETINSIDQNSGKQKIGKHHNALVAQLCDMLQTRLHQWKCDARVTNLSPAKTDALPEHSSDFRDIGIGIGVRRSTADHDKTGFGKIDWVDRVICLSDGLTNPVIGCLQHLQINR